MHISMYVVFKPEIKVFIFVLIKQRLKFCICQDLPFQETQARELPNVESPSTNGYTDDIARFIEEVIELSTALINSPWNSLFVLLTAHVGD